MRFSRPARFVPLLALLAAAPVLPAAESWPQFRGPAGTGVGATARPPVKFGPQENVAWRIDLPRSPSSPCVWGDRIFVTTFHEGRLETRCLDAADGRVRWTREFKPEHVEEHHRSDGSPAASTPATDGQRVVSYFGSFGLVCHDVEGRELWRHPLPLAESGGKFGSGTSPIIVGRHVLLNRDQHQFSSLLALDVATGRKLWETPRPDAAGSFGTPAYWKNNDADEIILGATAKLKAYDLATGAERWVIEGVTGMVCTSAVHAGGMLYFGAWSPGQADSPRPAWADFLKRYDKNGDGIVHLEEIDANRRDYMRGMDRTRDGKFTPEDWEILKQGDARADNLLLAIRPGGTGNISESHVAWRYRRGLPYVPTPLLYQDRIYFIRDGGLLSSLDPKSGEPYYAQEKLPATGNYYASPVAADGRIYLASLAGKVTVVRAGGEKPEVLHSVDFKSRILATPALVGKRLYLRTEKELWAFGE